MRSLFHAFRLRHFFYLAVSLGALALGLWFYSYITRPIPYVTRITRSDGVTSPTTIHEMPAGEQGCIYTSAVGVDAEGRYLEGRAVVNLQFGDVPPAPCEEGWYVRKLGRRRYMIRPFNSADPADDINISRVK